MRPGSPTFAAAHPYPFFLAQQLQALRCSSLGPNGRSGRSSGSGTASAPSWCAAAGQHLVVVARRGAGHRPLSGDRARLRRGPARGHGASTARCSPGTVNDGRPLPFAALQKRIGGKTLTQKVLARVAPVVLLAYDLLEAQGRDLREAALERTARCCCRRCWRSTQPTQPSAGEPLEPDRQSLDGARDLGQPRGTAAGQRARARRPRASCSSSAAMRATASAAPSRARSATWWKWKIDPMTVDAVLVYAQRGPRPARQPVHRLHVRGLGRPDPLQPRACAGWCPSPRPTPG